MNQAPYPVTTQPGSYSAGMPYPEQPPPYSGQPMYQQQMYPQPGYPSQPGYPPQQGYPPQPGYPQPGAPGQPIAMQPVSGGQGVNPSGWMQTPGSPPNSPPGLEYLGAVDQLIVKQKVEMFEAFTGFETNNRYEIRNSLGQKVYYAVEDTCFCTRNCCGSARPFDIKILDNNKREVMHLERPLRCSYSLCFCCLQKMEVQAPPGNVIGYVRQAFSCCIPRYKINNADDKTVLRIKGPCFHCDFCGEIEFEVTTPDESNHVGTISKQWSGLAKEIFTDADNFGVSFPMDLDIKTKATVLGAVFLIDFMYYEHDQDNNH